MTHHGKRVVLSEFEGPQLFREQLPRSGMIERDCFTKNGIQWSLLRLDQPFDYQVRDKKTKWFRGFEVRRILIRSRWAGFSVGGTEPTSVFVLLAVDDSQFDVEEIDPEAFYFEAWAMCRNEN